MRTVVFYKRVVSCKDSKNRTPHVRWWLIACPDFPRQSYGLGTIQPDGVSKLVFTFDKIALTKGQVFRIYFYENGGARNLTMTLNINDVNMPMRF